jgi:MFS family permease
LKRLKLTLISLIGRIVPNYIADKVGRFNVMIVMTLFSSILVLALWLPGRGNGAFITFAVLFGISSGAGIGLGPVLIANISPMKELGFRMGTILAIAAIGTLTSPPIAGVIAAAHGGSYTYAAVFAGISFFVATVGIFILRTLLVGLNLMAKI